MISRGEQRRIATVRGLLPVGAVRTPARLYETRSTARSGLCFCEACLLAVPSRRALKAATHLAVRAAVNKRVDRGSVDGVSP